jgi:hypothetical protein
LDLYLTHEALGKFPNVFEKHLISILNTLFKKFENYANALNERSFPLLRNRGKKPPLHSPFALHMF